MILNLSNFIYSLLLENETVIIPGFGAFISTYKPAEIGENEIKPPSKEISFTQKIKNNDGLLVELIARKAKISQNNALKRVDKARENMLYELDKGETVILEDIGSLSYKENNEIEFVPFLKDNLLLDSFGLETITKEEAEKANTVEPIKESNNEGIKPLTGAAILINTEDIEENKPESSKQKKPVESVSDSNNEKEAETKKEKILADFKFPEFKEAETVEKEDEKKRKKFAWYWYLLILIPLFIGVYFVIMNNSKPPETELPEQTETNIPPVEDMTKTTAPDDSIKNNSAIVEEEPVSIKTTENEIIDRSISGKYYLIRGGFEEEENVKEYMQQLKADGVECFMAGKTGRLILIGIEEFDTEEEAMRALNRYYKTKPDWKLWVHKAK